MTDVPNQQGHAAVAPELVAVRVVVRACIGGFLVVALLAISALACWRAEPVFLRVLIAVAGLSITIWYAARGFGPALKFLAGRGAGCSSSLRSRASRLAVMGLLGFTVLVGASFVRCMVEEASWQAVSAMALRVEHLDHAPRGIVFTVRRKVPVVEVWRRRVSLMPWLPQHESVPFRVRLVGEGEEQILVEYAFRARQEWGIALRFADDHWDSMSPYAPAAPTIDEAAWQSLWATAEQRGH